MNVSRCIQPFDSIQPGEIVDLWIPVLNPEAEEAEGWLSRMVGRLSAASRRSPDRVGGLVADRIATSGQTIAARGRQAVGRMP